MNVYKLFATTVNGTTLNHFFEQIFKEINFYMKKILIKQKNSKTSESMKKVRRNGKIEVYE